MGLAARRSVLQELGYKITTAGSASEALETFSGGHFDLLVTDYRMPRMNGIELIQRIRKQKEELPVILLSGVADTLGLTESNTGADVVIQKSANEVNHLVRAVTRLLRKKTPRKPPVRVQAAPAARRKTV
jgi:CheY-like chemotaxis protein